MRFDFDDLLESDRPLEFWEGDDFENEETTEEMLLFTVIDLLHLPNFFENALPDEFVE